MKEILSEYDILENHFQNKQGMRTDLTSVPQNKGYSKRDEISSQIGVSSSSLGKLLFIRKNNPNHIEMIDKGVLTIRQSYTQTQREVNENKSREKRNRVGVEIHKWRFYQKSSNDMSELKNGEVQTIFTSPPYWNKRLYSDEGGLGNEKTSEEFVVNLSNHFKDCKRVLSDKGSFFLNLGDTFLNSESVFINCIILNLTNKTNIEVSFGSGSSPHYANGTTMYFSPSQFTASGVYPDSAWQGKQSLILDGTSYTYATVPLIASFGSTTVARDYRIYAQNSTQYTNLTVTCPKLYGTVENIA